MFQINDNFQKLPGSYLFSTIAKKVAAYQEANPDKEIIRLGIGDVTQPLAPAIIDALHKAVDEMGMQLHSTDTHLTSDMSSSEKQFQTTTTRQEDVISQQMRFLFQTEQRVIQPISRSFSQQTAASLLQILFTLYMLIPMSWQEEQAHMMLRKRPGAM